MSDRLTPASVARRDFLGLAGLWAAGVAIVGSLLGMMRLTRPAVLPEQGRRFRIGRPEDFDVGAAQVVPGHRVLVVSDPRGIAAISLVCSHLGCIVARSEKGFECPCHGSAFDAEGRAVAGPAPRGLAWYEVSLGVDGRLIIDAGREVPAGTFFKV